jgi:protein-L-isoaspartate O-methyltransferase
MRREMFIGDGPPGGLSKAAGPVDDEAQAFWLKNLLQADAFTRWVVEEISPWIGGRLLEIGGGIGTYTAEFAPLCESVTSVDLNKEFVAEAKQRLKSFKNVEIIHGDATEEQPVARQGDGYDSIVLLDVLEHIEFDNDFVKSLWRRLKPGGRLILKVPAMPALYSPMDEAIGHWRRYSKKTLLTALQVANLEPLYVGNFNAFAVPGWFLNGRMLKRRHPPAEQIALFNKIVPIIRHLDRAARQICGISLIGVGRRAI